MSRFKTSGLKEMTDLDKGWVAGIIEGEGSFRIKSHASEKRQTQIALQVNMCDEDVVRRLHEVTGVGNVSGPYSRPNRPKHTPIWHWSVGARNEVLDLIAVVRPLMSKRRTAKIETLTG